MKKFNCLFLISIVFGLSFFSCEKEEEFPKSTNEYFSISDAKYIDKALPSGSLNIISDFQINHTAISGGSSIATFSSSERLQSVNVAIGGLPGYYQCGLSESFSAAGIYHYQVVLLINQNIKAKNFFIRISGVTIDGNTSAVATSTSVSVREVGTGVLQISLSWDQSADLDLHLFEPDGNEVYYEYPFSVFNSDSTTYFKFYCYLVNKYTDHKTSGLDYRNDDDWKLLNEYFKDIPNTVNANAEVKLYFKENLYGLLDLDSNASCKNGVNNENITYEKRRLQGKYTIAVDLYEKCDSLFLSPGATYSVTVNYLGKPVFISEKQVGKFADDYPGSENDPDKYVIIGTFTIGDGEGELRSSVEERVQQHPMIKEMNKKLFHTKE
jgi:hypothetical protein